MYPPFCACHVAIDSCDDFVVYSCQFVNGFTSDLSCSGSRQQRLRRPHKPGILCRHEKTGDQRLKRVTHKDRVIFCVAGNTEYDEKTGSVGLGRLNRKRKPPEARLTGTLTNALSHWLADTRMSHSGRVSGICRACSARQSAADRQQPLRELSTELSLLCPRHQQSARSNAAQCLRVLSPGRFASLLTLIKPPCSFLNHALSQA